MKAEAPTPVSAPRDDCNPSALEAGEPDVVAPDAVEALSTIPEGVVPSVNEAPHCDCKPGAVSETMSGISVLSTLYAALMQLVHVRLAGIAERLAPATVEMILLRLRGPTTPSRLVRVWVIQLVLESFRHKIFLAVG